MTSEEIREICNDRLGAWTKCLVEDHATPVILIGEGHDEELGKTVILLIKDLSDGEALAFLSSAARVFSRRVGRN